MRLAPILAAVALHSFELVVADRDDELYSVLKKVLADHDHDVANKEATCNWEAKRCPEGTCDYCLEYYTETEIQDKINHELVIFGLILWALMVVAFFLPLLIPDQWFDKDLVARERYDGKSIKIKREGGWRNKSYWIYYRMAVGGGLLACVFLSIIVLLLIVKTKPQRSFYKTMNKADNDFKMAVEALCWLTLATAIVGFMGCVGCCYERFHAKRKNDYNPKTEHVVDRRVRRDRLQVAVSLKKRLDAITNFSKWIVGFTAFVIASGAIKDQRHFRAFRDYNFYYNAGFIFLLFTFVLFLFCGAVSSGLSQQIEIGHISKYCPFFTWFLQVLNLFGVICFLHATTLFQETFHWGAPYKKLPRALTIAFVASYGLVWLFFTVSTVELFEESKILANSRDFGKLKDGTWTSSRLANILNDLFPYRDKELYEHFNCKPIADKPWGPKATTSYTVSDCETPLAVARANGHSYVVELLEKRFAEKFPLHATAKDGDIEKMTKLLDDGAKVDGVAHGRTALFFACENGNLEAVELLLARGADIGCLTGVEPAPVDAVSPSKDGEPASPHP